MPQISLTDFVDIVSKSGAPKATKVAQVKQRPEYEPAFDFYKPLRDRIGEAHRNDEDKRVLPQFLAQVTDPKKQKNYPELINGYTKWWGRKNLVWFDPPRKTYSAAGIELIVNPEVGLIVDGVPYLIKLYFKNEALSKPRIGVINGVMEITLRRACKKHEIMSVLDVRNAKLFPLSSPIGRTQVVLDAELAYIAALWPHV